ncbi:MAG: LemA family protein [Candidatus Shapirobacteria bacterium]|nr:LemA family protein [Candidatus Shapirobacteria bacterium]
MFIFLAIIIILALVLMSFYNKFKTLQVRIKASLQEIGNQLKRQADLIPNLVDSVKGFMKHEKGIFDELTSARKMVETAASNNNPKLIDKAQESVNKVLSSLRVVVESNPEIQSSGLVNNLMDELRDTADKIMYARRTLIDLTADYNTSIATIPGLWIAQLFGFKEEKGLSMPDSVSATTVTSEDLKNPKVNL